MSKYKRKHSLDILITVKLLKKKTSKLLNW